MVTKQIEIASQSTIYSVAFADENQVLAGHQDGYIRQWRIEDGQEQGPTMRGSGGICSIAVSQDGRWIVSGDDENQAIVWNGVTHEKVVHVEHEAYIFAVDISNDCTKVVTASWAAVGETARIFDTASGTDLFPLVSPGHLRGIKFSPDGSRFATASFHDGVRVYSTHNGDIL